MSHIIKRMISIIQQNVTSGFTALFLLEIVHIKKCSHQKGKKPMEYQKKENYITENITKAHPVQQMGSLLPQRRIKSVQRGGYIISFLKRLVSKISETAFASFPFSLSKVSPPDIQSHLFFLLPFSISFPHYHSNNLSCSITLLNLLNKLTRFSIVSNPLF